MNEIVRVLVLVAVVIVVFFRVVKSSKEIRRLRCLIVSDFNPPKTPRYYHRDELRGIAGGITSESCGFR